MSEQKRILIMAGGTGGHVFPALAVANILRAEGVDVQWMGTRAGLEARVVAQNKIPMHIIQVSGVRGKGLAAKLLAPIQILRALFQSVTAIRRAKPDCVLGMGGFVAGPGGVAARLLGKPLVIHEQNSVAGLTNKWLAKIANYVLTGFPDVEGLPDTADWVGNPVRADIKAREPGKRKRLRVLVLGGSQGAHTLNMKLPLVFSEFRGEQLKVHHQTGKGRLQEVRSLYASYDIEARISEFIQDMAAEYQWADLVVARAGAMTIAECCAVGKPALLVPYPHSAGDHQIYNANAMVDVGGAEMVLNENLGDPQSVEVLRDLLRSRERLIEMGEKAHTLHKEDAAENVAAICRGYLDA